MTWNDGYFKKNGNQISVNDDNEEVFDANGVKIGYFKDGIIRDNTGNKLANCDYETKVNSSNFDVIHNFLRMFGINYWF